MISLYISSLKEDLQIKSDIEQPQVLFTDDGFLNLIKKYDKENLAVELSFLTFAENVLLHTFSSFVENGSKNDQQSLIKLYRLCEKYGSNRVQELIKFNISRFRAVSFYRDKKFRKVVKILNLIVQNCPLRNGSPVAGLLDALLFLSSAYAQLKKFENAIKCSRLAVELSHHLLDVHKQRAAPYSEAEGPSSSGSYSYPINSAAHIDLLPLKDIRSELGLSLSPTYGFCLSYFNMAAIIEEAGMLPAAVEWYDRAVQAAAKFGLLLQLQEMVPALRSAKQRVKELQPLNSSSNENDNDSSLHHIHSLILQMRSGNMSSEGSDWHHHPRQLDHADIVDRVKELKFGNTGGRDQLTSDESDNNHFDSDNKETSALSDSNTNPPATTCVHHRSTASLPKLAHSAPNSPPLSARKPSESSATAKGRQRQQRHMSFTGIYSKSATATATAIATAWAKTRATEGPNEGDYNNNRKHRTELAVGLLSGMTGVTVNELSPDKTSTPLHLLSDGDLPTAAAAAAASITSPHANRNITLKGVILLQKFARSYIAKKRVTALWKQKVFTNRRKRQRAAVLLLQRCTRGFLCRKLIFKQLQPLRQLRDWRRAGKIQITVDSLSNQLMEIKDFILRQHHSNGGTSHQLLGVVDGCERVLQDIRKEKAEVESSLGLLENQRQEFYQVVTTERADRDERLQKQARWRKENREAEKKLLEERQVLEAAMTESRAMLTSMTSEKSRLERELRERRQAERELLKTISSLEDRVTAERERVLQMGKHIDQLQTEVVEIHRLKEERKMLRSTIESENKQFALKRTAMDDQLRHTISEKSLLETELNSLKNLFTQMEGVCSQQNLRLVQLQDVNESLESDNARLIDEKNQFQTILNGHRADISRSSLIANENSILNQEITDLNRRIKKLILFVSKQDETHRSHSDRLGMMLEDSVVREGRLFDSELKLRLENKSLVDQLEQLSRRSFRSPGSPSRYHSGSGSVGGGGGGRSFNTSPHKTPMSFAVSTGPDGDKPDNSPKHQMLAVATTVEEDNNSMLFHIGDSSDDEALDDLNWRESGGNGNGPVLASLTPAAAAMASSALHSEVNKRNRRLPFLSSLIDPVVRDAMVTRIQRYVRGYLARKTLRDIHCIRGLYAPRYHRRFFMDKEYQQYRMAVRLQCLQRQRIARREVETRRQQLLIEILAASVDPPITQSVPFSSSNLPEKNTRQTGNIKKNTSELKEDTKPPIVRNAPRFESFNRSSSRNLVSVESKFLKNNSDYRGDEIQRTASGYRKKAPQAAVVANTAANANVPPSRRQTLTSKNAKQQRETTTSSVNATKNNKTTK